MTKWYSEDTNHTSFGARIFELGAKLHSYTSKGPIGFDSLYQKTEELSRNIARSFKECFGQKQETQASIDATVVVDTVEQFWMDIESRSRPSPEKIGAGLPSHIRLEPSKKYLGTESQN